MDEQTFKRRTKQFALDVLQLVQEMPRNRAVDVMCSQLLRSATSVGANYRAACRGRSPADVLSRLAIVEEEGDESLYWMELLVESGTLRKNQVERLMVEANELVAMTVASIKTIRSGRQPSSRPKS